MSELVFERGLFATLAAALIVPELTTLLLFILVALSVTSLVARQAWMLVWVPASPSDATAFRVIAEPAVPPTI
jgi:hypothetical protein